MVWSCLLIGVWLLYSAVLVSALQRSEWAVAYILPFRGAPPQRRPRSSHSTAGHHRACRSSQSPGLSALHWITASHLLFHEWSCRYVAVTRSMQLLTLHSLLRLVFFKETSPHHLIPHPTKWNPLERNLMLNLLQWHSDSSLQYFCTYSGVIFLEVFLAYLIWSKCLYSLFPW